MTGNRRGNRMNPNKEEINQMPRSFSKHVFSGKAMPIVKLVGDDYSVLIGIEFKKTGREKLLTNYIGLRR